MGYLGLKDMQIMVDCQEYCLTRKDGKKLLCHVVKAKGRERMVTGNEPMVKFIVTRYVKGNMVI